MTNIDVIIPTFKSKDITLLTLKSFLKFNDYFDFKYIVVENSNDESYKNDVLSLSDNITWIQNPISEVGSFANANALHRGIKESASDYVFVCHNDVLAVHRDWMKFLFDKITKEDYCIAGFCKDNVRINAVHVSGILTTRNVIASVDLYPTGSGSILDVGDSLTQYCIDNNFRYFSCRNTHNISKLECELTPPFNRLNNVDRALSDTNEVLWLHIGRGTPKTHKTYHKSGRLTIDEWIEFGKNILQ